MGKACVALIYGEPFFMTFDKTFLTCLILTIKPQVFGLDTKEVFHNCCSNWFCKLCEYDTWLVLNLILFSLISLVNPFLKFR